jgi:hypothetical protein
MAYLQEIELDWNTWKTTKTTLSSATVYYLQNDLQYVPFLVEEGTSPIVAQSIYFVNVNRDPSSVKGPYAALTSGIKDTLHLQDIVYTANAYGTSGITVQYVDTSTAATGTVTVVNHLLLAGAVLTVNGVALTEGIQWSAATSNNATATSLASAISTATATTLCTASAAGAAITVTANSATFKSNSISLATSDATHLTLSGNYLTGGEGGAGYEYVVVTGTAIVVHLTNGQSSAQQVQAAVNGWNAYSGIPNYHSAASTELVAAVIDAGKEAHPQVVAAATPLAGGAAAVTVLSDWETNFMGSATKVASFSIGVALEL